MSGTHTESLSTIPSSLTTDELLRRLRQFPSPVLPVGVMRELQSRGDEVHDSLYALVERAIIAAKDGSLGSSHDIFFAFALLVPLATVEDRPLIEALLTLPDKAIDELIGQLDIEATPHFIANFFEGQNAAELIEWIDRVSEHPGLDGLNAIALYRGMTIAVARGHLERATAIDALVNRLQKRSDQRYDLQSALVVCELFELQARDSEAVDAVVRASFARKQIDTDYFDIDCWDEIDAHLEVLGKEDRWSDATAELCTWCYEFVSEDLDPINATYRANELASRSSFLPAASLPSLIDQLIHSSDKQFPRDAVKSLELNFADAYQATIDLISEELARYQTDSTAWCGNGAYLGLALTIASQMPLPRDLLDSILQMAVEDREQVFGDQFGLIVQAVALTPQHQYDFVEQWIWDADRSRADRREMVSFYLYARRNRLDREVTIDTLVTGLRRAMQEAPFLIAPYAETLAFLSPKKHSPLLQEALKRDDVEWFLPPKDLLRMEQDADFAREQFWELRLLYRSVTKIIAGGVMFDRSLIEEKPSWMISPTQSVQPQPVGTQSVWTQPDVLPTQTIRNDVRTGRNDPCPCGSGKKYKKCCSKM